MPKVDLKCRISADASGFHSVLRGLEGAGTKFAASMGKMFFAMFSIGSMRSAYKELVEFVKGVDNITDKYNLTNDVAQQFLEYSRKTGKSLESLLSSSEGIADAWERIEKAGIKPLMTPEQLQSIREADALLGRYYNKVKVWFAGQLGKRFSGGEPYFGPLTSSGFLGGWGVKNFANIFSNQMSKYQKTVFGGIGKLLVPQLRKVGLLPEKQEGIRFDEYGYSQAIPEDLQALWIDLLNQDTGKLVSGTPDKKVAALKSLGMKPSSDTLARIGGFVGESDRTAALTVIRAMNRHLSNIERALLSKGIKIQEIQ